MSSCNNSQCPYIHAIYGDSYQYTVQYLTHTGIKFAHFDEFSRATRFAIQADAKWAEVLDPNFEVVYTRS